MNQKSPSPSPSLSSSSPPNPSYSPINNNSLNNNNYNSSSSSIFPSQSTTLPRNNSPLSTPPLITTPNNILSPRHKPPSMIQSLSRRQSSNISEFNGDFAELFDILENPISCGYLYTFCISEYNSESIRYILAVDEFKDIMKRDYGCWKLNWKEVDKLMKINEKMLAIDNTTTATTTSTTTISPPNSNVVTANDPTPTNFSSKIGDNSASFTGLSNFNSLSCNNNYIWPSTKISENDVRIKIDEIFNEFIAHHAPSQICISADVYLRTQTRISLLHIYGTYVFDESLLDPFRTLKRDILPRFFNSKLYQEMIYRDTFVCNDAEVKDLHPPHPPSQSVLQHPHFKNGHHFDLNDILSYKELFSKFSIYSKKFYCIENLYCYRMIELFEIQACLRIDENVKDMAWNIYRFFVAEHSVHEVSISGGHRKKIMLQMGAPTWKMFEPIKQSVHSSLNTLFQKYSQTEEYLDLVKILKSELSTNKNSESENLSWRKRLMSIPQNLMTNLSNKTPVQWTRKRISAPQVHGETSPENEEVESLPTT